ncbi:hypothetical protein M5M_15275 [Simiduia agarivorans SA1 = DSM 21679]|uniref:Uncharacterized protein n=1 Tax=Simiduia agarivorans (strain DSM 21679 / JCM 13881 / BCRC 17597 / SA1) TaxID=1117647 RepID=K4L213_SIMAS|nr:hypothetical protein M5M_15275 [Simiduia agarivorans SA1 = DSM 21679]
MNLSANYCPYVVKDGILLGTIQLRSFLQDSQPALEYSYDSELVGVVKGDDYFDLLGMLRTILQEKGFDILCEGALINVFPGGLVSDQSFSEVAYKHVEPGGQLIKVNIFSPAKESELDMIAGRDSQREARRKVIRSRRK